MSTLPIPKNQTKGPKGASGDIFGLGHVGNASTGFENSDPNLTRLGHDSLKSVMVRSLNSRLGRANVASTAKRLRLKVALRRSWLAFETLKAKSCYSSRPVIK